MKIACVGPKRGSQGELWKTSHPFAVNPRGILAHRVRYVAEHHASWGSHGYVGYWCGNGACFDLAAADAVIVAVPPKGRLLCAFCEMRAQATGQEKADKLAGKHVHRGVLRAHRVCCGGEAN